MNEPDFKGFCGICELARVFHALRVNCRRRPGQITRLMHARVEQCQRAIERCMCIQRLQELGE